MLIKLHSDHYDEPQSCLESTSSLDTPPQTAKRPLFFDVYLAWAGSSEHTKHAVGYASSQLLCDLGGPAVSDWSWICNELVDY